MYNTLLIKDVYAGEIFDSEGSPAIEIKILAEEGAYGHFSITCQDSDCKINKQKDKCLFSEDRIKVFKHNVGQTTDYINSVIAPKLIGINVFEQEEIDSRLLDMIRGGKINGSAVCFGISAAAAKAAANALGFPLFRYLGGAGRTRIPVPAIRIFPSRILRKKTDEQKVYMLVPTVSEVFLYDSLAMCCEIICEMYNIFLENDMCESDAVFIMKETKFRDIYTVAEEAAVRAGYSMGKDLMLGRGDISVKLTTGCNNGHGNLRIRKELKNEDRNMVIINPENFNTITELFEFAGGIRKKERETALYLSDGGCKNALYADMAAALGTDYMIGGSVPWGEDIIVYNRLIQIENEIKSRPSFRVARPGRC